MKCNYCQNGCKRIVDESLAPFIPRLSVATYVSQDGYLMVSGTFMVDKYNGRTRTVSEKTNYCPMYGRKLGD